jgi:AcrR family transcriptional regulator
VDEQLHAGDDGQVSQPVGRSADQPAGRTTSQPAGRATGRPVGRGRDRRGQLATVAAELFHQRGYHDVGVNDIAAAAGITGPAVYRHFRSKQEILGHVVLAGVDQLITAVHAALDAADSTSGPERLDVLLRAMAALSVERRELGALWRREERSLPAADRTELAARLSKATRFVADLVEMVRPALSGEDAMLLCSAALSVFGSISDHHVSLPKSRFERLLHSMAEAMILSDAVVPTNAAPSTGLLHSLPATEPAALSDHRREQLLSVAARMFCERGFHDVTMEDIGSAAGIAGPSIYRHYSSKADLLLAMCNRVGERLRSGLVSALSEGVPPAILNSLVESFVDAMLSHRNLVTAFLTEGRSLPDRDRAEVRRALRGYVAEWVRIVVAAAPHLDEKEARIRVYAAFAVVSDLTRTSHFATRPNLPHELVTLATAALNP